MTVRMALYATTRVLACDRLVMNRGTLQNLGAGLECQCTSEPKMHYDTYQLRYVKPQDFYTFSEWVPKKTYLSHGLSMRFARMQIFAIEPQGGFRMLNENE